MHSLYCNITSVRNINFTNDRGAENLITLVTSSSIRQQPYYLINLFPILARFNKVIRF